MARYVETFDNVKVPAAFELSRGHYTLYNSLKNLPPTILDVFKFPWLFVRDFTKKIKIDIDLG